VVIFKFSQNPEFLKDFIFFSQNPEFQKFQKIFSKLPLNKNSHFKSPTKPFQAIKFRQRFSSLKHTLISPIDWATNFLCFFLPSSTFRIFA
jgi:hypothetical protein